MKWLHCWPLQKSQLWDNVVPFIRSVLFRNISDVLWEAISTRQVLSLYQGLGTKNLQSFISQFIYFYGYSFFKRLYLQKSDNKSIGTRANLIVAAAAGACTVIVTQVSKWYFEAFLLLGTCILIYMQFILMASLSMVSIDKWKLSRLRFQVEICCRSALQVLWLSCWLDIAWKANA